VSEFTAAMDDDLNTPRALAALFDAAREGNRLLDAGELPTPEFRSAWDRAVGVLQVLPSAARKIVLGGTVTPTGSLDLKVLTETPPTDPAEAQGWAEGWATRRLAAKGARNWAEADRIRDLLAAAGWQVRDRKDGTAEVVRS